MDRTNGTIYAKLDVRLGRMGFESNSRTTLLFITGRGTLANGTIYTI